MQAGMPAVHADASRDEVLREVGIERAKGLIAALASDADNLFLILTARTLNPSLRISARVAEESAEPEMRRAGATFVAYCDRTIEDLRIRRETGVIVLAIRRASGRMIFNPPADTELAGGDYLIAMGEPAGLRQLEQMLMGAQQ